MPIGLRQSVPLKITSAISPPRNALADCSPSTQRMASRDVGFAAAVRADDGGDAGVEVKSGLVREGFEPKEFERLEVHDLRRVPKGLTAP